jgi:hypothetical protein
MIVPSAHTGTASAVIIDRPRRYSEQFRYARQTCGNAYNLARLTTRPGCGGADRYLVLTTTENPAPACGMEKPSEKRTDSAREFML